MKNFVAFQSQLASIMEVLAKAAVAEISKLVEDGSVVLYLEVSRSHKEIDSLRRKLQQVESELRTARDAAARESRSIGVQVEDQFGRAERVFPTGVVVGGDDAGERRPFEQKHFEEEFDPQTSDTQPAFGFTVKAEQEEEHVAQTLNQTGCEHSAGRLNDLGSEYVMYKRDSQLWTSFTQGDNDIATNDVVCSDTMEKCSQSLSVHSPLQHAPAIVEVSGSMLSSLGKDVHVVHGVLVKEEAGGQCSYTEENRSEMGGTEQTEYRQPSLSISDNQTSQLFQPLQQPLDWQIGITDRIADPSSNGRKKTSIHWRSGIGKKPYSCTQCEKSFSRFIDLERHQRSHTGEKPFSCAQCGKGFSLRCNLLRHERVHSGSKPFGCTHCGKRFAPGTNLRAHYRIHTGERPYHCTQCGKNFTQLGSLKAHQKVHSRNELLQFGMSCT
ncbi:zinc finger protein with KRAB and SCAN domains 1-like [Anguilla anguilla]|uniref:zinc finger protein with KRAB and SCAN domains 1-like n=1 Tax=Anguilla anguilla TaxID=7936 RepID=UPI0015B10056|nr:zinc finger protein with KRAB and SCAN domains 1-like [Anguilla anguilla]